MNEPEHNDDRTQSLVMLKGGVVVSHYRIIEKIGAGGMGEVYLAEDTELNRKVALKFLPPHLCQDADCRARFKREAQAAAALSHPNIITIYEVAEHEGRPFFAMELVEGRSLREFADWRELEFEKIVNLAIQICDGLGAAHDKNVIHRDIKPSNISIDAYGRPKILDFGLAAIQGGEHLTKTGSTMGTVRYMSPEQVQGKEVDSRSDLFSLGVVLYELVTGRSPFSRENDVASVQAILTEVPEPLAKYRSGVPEEFQRTVSKLLEKDSSTRYQTAAGVISDLRRLGGPTQSMSVETPARRRASWPLWIGAGIVMAAVVIALYTFWSMEQAGESGGRKMLAVLPFENLGNPEDEYFADGITEEITARLAAVRELGVIARTSVLQYKGTTKSIAEIGDELGVDYVLEGTVRWQKVPGSAGRVRVTPQLIKVSDATHAWADIYDDVMAEVFDVQTDIAEQIVEALGMTLLEPARNQLSRAPTDNIEAFDYYLQGNAFFSQGYLHKRPMQASAQLYQRAVESDPGFVTAWARLARAYNELYWHQERSPADLAQAERAVAQASAINPDHPEVHISKGSMYYHAGAYGEALQEFNVALESMPNNADLLAEIAYSFYRQGL
ncbi:MAG: protein kinase, partial [Candidatus Zixiibacteriota bacterium]